MKNFIQSGDADELKFSEFDHGYDKLKCLVGGHGLYFQVYTFPIDVSSIVVKQNPVPRILAAEAEKTPQFYNPIIFYSRDEVSKME
jgi:hypothetical protein